MIIPLEPVELTSVADHYDDLDDFYREIWGEHLHHGLWRSGTESVTERARWLTQEFAARVTALTMSPAQFAFASRVDPGTVNPTYLLRDCLENDLPSASCDCALAIESTEHMQNKMEIFCEIHRVLRPGGCLAVCA